MQKNKSKQIKEVILFLLPVTVLLTAVIVYPLLRGILMSFTNYNLLKPDKAKIVWLDNFVKIFTNDKTFMKSLLFSFIYAIFSVAGSFLLGLFCAMLMNQKLRFQGVFRALLLLPWVVSTVVAANVWSWILNSETGLINTILMSWHLISKPIPFLSTATMAKITVFIVGSWKNFPFMMLTILAGLQSIPSEVYESASIDGGNRRQVFFHVTLPLLKPVILISLVLMTIWNFNNFDLIYLLTSGGPIDATTTVPIYAYNTAFYRNKMGYSSAVSVIMMICMMVMSTIYMKLLEHKD